jgi:hypothetical protein
MQTKPKQIDVNKITIFNMDAVHSLISRASETLPAEHRKELSKKYKKWLDLNKEPIVNGIFESILKQCELH